MTAHNVDSRGKSGHLSGEPSSSREPSTCSEVIARANGKVYSFELEFVGAPARTAQVSDRALVQRKLRM